ncbi:MAG: uracil-DNA glycosylase [Christensenellaceae bacterium]|nr:uracil-DNA glycosylase [Christensenellaceae bacterium]
MKLNEDWKTAIEPYRDETALRALYGRLQKEYANHKICPPNEAVFRAFDLCSLNNLKVVILGQDPYFNAGQATGLAFSINPAVVGQNGVQFPPTLRNIIKEIESEFGSCAVADGNLDSWAKQGVLLLNTCLTVRQGAALSHQNIGWDSFINSVIKRLNDENDIVFLLWGGNAKAYRSFLTNPNNLVLTTTHPSPLSASYGFMGCGHFIKANEFLAEHGKTPIAW